MRNYLGIDFGILLTADSDGNFYKATPFEKRQIQFHWSIGVGRTVESYNENRKKMALFQESIALRYASEIVSLAHRTGRSIAMESSGLGPHAILKRVISSHASIYEVDVVIVNSSGTTIRCSNCFNQDKKNRRGKIFECTKCGYSNHIDTNAAINVSILALDKYPKAVEIKKIEKRVYDESALVG